MFKIGDFARLGQISVRMLRHYDKLGLLKPSHTDKFTSYRYYTIDQLARLHRIVALNGLGLTLQQIADLLGFDNQLPVEQLRGMLLLRQAELAQELAEKQAQITGVAARLQQIELEGQSSPYEIVVKALEPIVVAGIRTIVPSIGQMGDYCCTMYEQLYAALEQHGLAPAGPELTIYHNEEFTEVDLDMEAAVVVQPSQHTLQNPTSSLLIHQLPGTPTAAALIYEGDFAEIDGAVLSLFGWIGSHQHTLAGSLRELHLSGPIHASGQFVEPGVIELQMPITKLAE